MTTPRSLGRCAGRTEPATPRTLRAWRRIGLLLGVPAAGLLTAAVAIRLAVGRDDAWYAALAVPGVLLGLLAGVFLRRVWSEPGHPTGAVSVWGHRLSSAFLTLWGLGVVLNLVAEEVAVPSWLRSTVALAMSASLLATVALALGERPGYARR
ncbi:hypothetical protein [Blastococcus atacamensis]|uniref:hypothetical protein n=1 Tax=Blastococcus atacamensis TaxID=2070508 RepID=UPI000CEBAC88|nr:hypothetical protein [Blastococcus atacamensis]